MLCGCIQQYMRGPFTTVYMKEAGCVCVCKINWVSREKVNWMSVFKWNSSYPIWIIFNRIIHFECHHMENDSFYLQARPKTLFCCGICFIYSVHLWKRLDFYDSMLLFMRRSQIWSPPFPSQFWFDNDLQRV